MRADGSVEVSVGTTEMGQGPRTVMAQIAAEELGMSSDHVRVLGADTRFTPYDRSTGASRSTTLAGKAVQNAAAAVATRLRETAGDVWDVTPELVELRDGCAAYGDQELEFSEVIAKRFGFSGGEIIEGGEVRPTGGDTGSYAEGPVFWEVCVAAAEVELDPELGSVSVTRTATIADVGKAINPQLVERQDEGAFMQGFGNAMFRGDGLRRRPAAQRQPARVPRAAHPRPSAADDLDRGRERRRPWPPRREGLRRGSAGRCARRDRERAGRRRRPHDRAATHARTRLAGA